MYKKAKKSGRWQILSQLCASLLFFFLPPATFVVLLYLLSYSNLNQTCTVLIKELASLTLNKLLHVEKTLTN